MLNASMLNHPQVGVNIFLAMREAVNFSFMRGGLASAYVANSKGECYIRITYTHKAVNAFVFWDKQGNNVTQLILNFLKNEG